MSWYLIFERTSPGRSPGAVQTAGLFGGSRTDTPDYRGFKCLLAVEVQEIPGRDNWDLALEAAVKLTGRLGEFAAIECEVFIPDMLQVREQAKQLRERN